MEIWLLGSLDVVDDDGNAVTLSGVRLRSLLTALALHCGEVVTDDALVDAVWGHEAPARRANALQRQVSTLRAALGAPELIERRGSGYVLTLDPTVIDVLQFDALAERGLGALRHGDPTRARTLLDDALRLWRGDPLSDVTYADFAQPEIARLSEARAVVLEARIDADLALGRYADVISELEQLVLRYPLREHLRAQLMLALSRAGRPAEALRAYQDARRVLREELGLEPSVELRALETAILREEVSLTRAKTNVRTPLNKLIGRDADLASLRRRVDAHRLVTLVGPGGVGKSRLALELASTWLVTRDSEVWIVGLADVERNDDVVPAIMRALELPRAGNQDADAKRLVEYLCGHRSLVILDNCEHVVGVVAQVAQDLLESCADLRICTTSREGLAVPSEVLMPVPPLALDDAMALFVERARAVDASFESTDQSAALQGSIAELCTRVDGLPLAIELAAARLRAMSVTELVAGLDDRFRILNRGARTALLRQQTLRAVVDWSYELLFEDERRVFERLSVFRGSCSLAAARVVCADEDISADDVGELVARLVDKSLVIAERDEDDGSTRCHMLQTLVDYGRDRLEESGDAAGVFQRHVRYYRDLAFQSLAALRGVKQREWLHAVTANLANLRAAFDVSVSENDAETAYRIAGCLGWYWWFTGRAPEGSQWLADARSCAGPVGEVTRARVLAWSAFAGAPGFVGWSDARGPHAVEDHRSTGQLTIGELDDLCGEATDLYGRHSEASEEFAGAELALSVAYSTLGRFSRAAELVTDAERRLAAATDARPEARAMQAFAGARRAFVEDDYSTAEEAFRVSAVLLAEYGVDVHQAFALRYRARLASLRGDLAPAVDALDRAVTLARRLGMGGFANMLLADLAQAFAASEDFERARSTLTALLTAAREVGFLPGIADSLTALALVEWRAGELERAADYARQGAEAAARVEHSEAAVYCGAVLGLVAGALDQGQEARDQLARALNDARALASAPRAVAFVLECYAAIIADENAATSARLHGAADTLRRSPGQAAGVAFAATALGRDDLLPRLYESLPRSVVVAEFDAGAADPESVIASTLAGAAS